MSTNLHHSPLIALIAGEASGDQLGAALIAALRQRYPQARFVGIGGARMQQEGFESWYDIRELSLLGLVEVLRHLPRLLKLRSALTRRLLRERPAAVIGIDAPDFNLGLERKLKRAGLCTIHYVSPSVWAWRAKRAAKIGRSASRILCLLPMEPAIYAQYGVDARFVGHPLADRFPLVSDRAAAREALQLPQEAPVLAVLPGSRNAEIERLGAVFFDAAARVAAALPELHIVVPAANADIYQRLQRMLAVHVKDNGPTLRLLQGQAHQAMVAADIVLLASGTATLEAMLAKRPMVAAYKISPGSYYLARILRLLKTDVYTLPNILARACGLGDKIKLVPELMQHACTADKLAEAVLALLRNSQQRGAIVAAFEHLHHALRGELNDSAAACAAAAIAESIEAHHAQRT